MNTYLIKSQDEPYVYVAVFSNLPASEVFAPMTFAAGAENLLARTRRMGACIP